MPFAMNEKIMFIINKLKLYENNSSERGQFYFVSLIHFNDFNPQISGYFRISLNVSTYYIKWGQFQNS